MEGAEQAQAYAEADFSATDQAMVERIADLYGDRLGARIVDLGCGPGNISFRLAERYPLSEVLGVDGSEAMLALAKARLEQEQQCSSPAGSLRFQQVLLPAPGLEGGMTPW